MHKGFRTYTKYAPSHRGQRSQGGVYSTAAGEGIASQTRVRVGCPPIIEEFDEKRGRYFLVESERFATRYYLLCQLSTGWRFTGDESLKEKYVAKVEAFIASRETVAA